MTNATYLSGLQHCRGDARVVLPVLTCALSTHSAAKRNRFHQACAHAVSLPWLLFISSVSGRHTQYACLLQSAGTQQNKHAAQCAQQPPRQPVVQCQSNCVTTTSSLQVLDTQAPKRRCRTNATCTALFENNKCSTSMHVSVAAEFCLFVKAYWPKCAQDNIAHLVYRRLIIMRHADSIERTDPQTRDHERSITDMGRKAAQQVRLLEVQDIRSLIALQHDVVSCLCICAVSGQGCSICICNCADMLACGLQEAHFYLKVRLHLHAAKLLSQDINQQLVCIWQLLRMAGACCHRLQHEQHVLHSISCICLQCFMSHLHLECRTALQWHLLRTACI